MFDVIKIAGVFSLVVVGAACTLTRQPWTEFGAEYLGRTYETDPLGEGAGYDPDPLMRTDAFDCQTYVETVLACNDAGRLGQIRYANGVAEFTARNHFFTADWLKNNSALVHNISADFGGTATRSGIVTKKDWFKKTHGMDVDVAPINANIEYVPYSALAKFDVDEPVLVAFVVDNPATRVRIGSDILVSHVGFLIPGGVLRHASSTAGKVVDVSFRDYVASRGGGKTNLGVAFFKIKEFCQ